MPIRKPLSSRFLCLPNLNHPLPTHPVAPSSPVLSLPKPPRHAGIYDTLKECACISKSAGGIGLSMHNIRSTGSYIRGTNGTSNGIIPMLRVFNDTGEAAAGPGDGYSMPGRVLHAREVQRVCWEGAKCFWNTRTFPIAFHNPQYLFLVLGGEGPGSLRFTPPITAWLKGRRWSLGMSAAAAACSSSRCLSWAPLLVLCALHPCHFNAAARLLR
jgi:hypothetical protein